MKRYSKLVSLGPSCETAYQIRQIVQQEEAYVFDWIIAPATSIARAIATDFTEIVYAPSLYLACRGNERFIADTLTNIEYHHDFVNNDSFLESIASVQDKYDYLISRTRALLDSNASVLFLHQNGTSQEAYHLEAVLSKKHPNLDFDILAIKCGDKSQCTQKGRILFADILGDGSNWQQRTPQWSALLDSLLADSYGVSLTRRDPATRDAVPTS